MIALPVEDLCRTDFMPFGDVIEADEQATQLAINAGTSQRFHDLARLEPGAGGRLIVSIFRAQARELPFTIRVLERHPRASQAFMPLSGRPFLVVVAPAGDVIDPKQIRAFRVGGHQGVNFAPGVWHHPLIAMQAESDFLVIDRDDPSGNCEERALPQALSLDPDQRPG